MKTRMLSAAGIACGFVFTSLAVVPGAARAGVVPLQNATATYTQVISGTWPPDYATDGLFDDFNGWAIATSGSFGGASSQTAVWETTSDLSAADLTFTLHFLHSNPNHVLGRFRFSVTTDDRSTFADGVDSGGDVTANWTVLADPIVSGPAGMTFTVLGDDSILVGGTVPAQVVYTMSYATVVTGVTGIRLEALEDPSLPGGDGPGFAINGNFVLTEMVLATADHLVGFKTKAPKKDALGAPLPSNVFPSGWALTADDTVLADTDADDPENYVVRSARGLLSVATKNDEPAPTPSDLRYVRYQIAPAKEGIGDQLPGGEFPPAVKHLPRTWQLDNQLGTINVTSKKVDSMLVPAAADLVTAPGPPAESTHFLCYAVKATGDVTTQTTDGKFRKDFQAFFSETLLDDCALLADMMTPSFQSTAMMGKCLFGLKSPSLLCNPMNKREVVAPRETTATIVGSTALSARSLLCYKTKLASKFVSTSAAALVGASVGDGIDPKQAKHAKRATKDGNPIYTAVANQFPNPDLLDSLSREMVCIPTNVLAVSLLP